MGVSDRLRKVKVVRKIEKKKVVVDKVNILGINGIRTGLDVRPVHSNRNIIIVKLSLYL